MDTMTQNTAGRKPRLILCCTGSVATVKVPELTLKLSQYFQVQHHNFLFLRNSLDIVAPVRLQVKVVATHAGTYMLKHVAPTYDPISSNDFRHIKVFEDQDEWVQMLPILR